MPYTLYMHMHTHAHTHEHTHTHIHARAHMRESPCHLGAALVVVMLVSFSLI